MPVSGPSGFVANYTLNVPSAPFFYGVQLYVQALSVDPAMSAAVPIAVSNAIEATIGL